MKSRHTGRPNVGQVRRAAEDEGPSSRRERDDQGGNQSSDGSTGKGAGQPVYLP